MAIDCKVSMHVGKKYSIAHNVRDWGSKDWNKDGHIDKSRQHLNKVFVNEDFKKFFYATFSEAISDFNDKNRAKHPDRLMNIDDYYKEQKNRVQEVVIQLGDHDTYARLCESMGQTKADVAYQKIMEDTFRKWQNDNPSLRVFSATLHMDEVVNGSPHLHIDFLPVAESARGLTAKVSMDGALKQLGFKRDKEQKYGNTPYKQWLSDRRTTLENDFQKMVDELLGKGKVQILPAEHSSKAHKETWEHRAEQKGLKAVADFVSGKGKEKIQKAEEIIANAEKIAMAITAEATDKMKTADNRIAEAVRKEKVAEKQMATAETTAKEIVKKHAELKTAIDKHNQRVAHHKQVVAHHKRIVETEVQKRLAVLTAPQRRLEEDERYLRRIRSAHQQELEQQQAKYQQEQKKQQELAEKVKHKARKGFSR